MLFAVDEKDCVHAAAYVVWGGEVAYYLVGGGDPELRCSGAGSLVMWESILRAREVAPVFDFEGSMLPPVERFFRAFGGRQTPYLHAEPGNASSSPGAHRPQGTAAAAPAHAVDVIGDWATMPGRPQAEE